MFNKPLSGLSSSERTELKQSPSEFFPSPQVKTAWQSDACRL